MDEDLWIPVIFMVSVAVTFGLWIYFRYRTSLATQETLRLALEKGCELSPEFIKQLAEPAPGKERDLRRGLIWVAFGIAMIILAAGIGEPDAMGPIMGSAAFPGLVGVAYLIMWRFGARQE